MLEYARDRSVFFFSCSLHLQMSMSDSRNSTSSARYTCGGEREEYATIQHKKERGSDRCNALSHSVTTGRPNKGGRRSTLKAPVTIGENDDDDDDHDDDDDWALSIFAVNDATGLHVRSTNPHT